MTIEIRLYQYDEREDYVQLGIVLPRQVLKPIGREERAAERYQEDYGGDMDLVGSDWAPQKKREQPCTGKIIPSGGDIDIFDPVLQN